MDLIIESHDFKFSIDHYAASFVHMFISSKIHHTFLTGICHLTKKEIAELITYISSHEQDFCNTHTFQYLYDNLISIHMLMRTDEKVKFTFW